MLWFFDKPQWRRLSPIVARIQNSRVKEAYGNNFKEPVVTLSMTTDDECLTYLWDSAVSADIKSAKVVALNGSIGVN